MLVLSGALAFGLPQLFQVPADIRVQSQWLFFLMSLAFVATVPNAVFWSVLYAKQRFDLINFSTSAGLALRAVALLGAFRQVVADSGGDL